MNTGSFSGSQLRKLRRACGLSRTQLAHIIGRESKQLQKYEAGRAVPPAPVQSAIAKALGVPVDALHGATESK